MVRQFVRLFTLWAWICPLLLAAEVKVAVTVNGSALSEDAPIYPKITVSRDEGQEIDPNSFTMDGRPLDVEFIGDSRHRSIVIINGVQRDENLQISTYRFRMEGRKAGLHVIPPISVMVDGQRYQSPQSAFSISTASVTTDLRLESSVEGDQPIYPGQKIRIVYRIYFQQNIELTLSELPTDAGNAFRSIGSQQVETFREGGFYVQEVAQELEALTPGDHSFGPGVIEGYTYEQDFFGRRILKQPRLRAQSQALKVSVQPFPTEGKPLSFSGAIGDFSIQSKLLTDYRVSVGDKMELEVTVYGSGDLQSLSLPPLAKQQGFPRAFRLSDLPPTGEVEGRAKRFVVELRPLSEEVKSIPSIAFSYFNPKSKSYETVQTNPIGIQVSPLRGPSRTTVKEESKEQAVPPVSEDGETVEEANWDEDLAKAERIQTLGNYPLTADDLSVHWLQQPYVLFIIPLGLVLLALQVTTKRSKEGQKEIEPKQSARDLYEQAMRSQNKTEVFYPLLEKALLLRLYETKHTEEEASSSAQLGRGGLVGDVRSFLTLLEAQRFSGKKLLANDQLISRAQQLFERIK